MSVLGETYSKLAIAVVSQVCYSENIVNIIHDVS